MSLIFVSQITAETSVIFPLICEMVNWDKLPTSEMHVLRTRCVSNDLALSFLIIFLQFGSVAKFMDLNQVHGLENCR